jgi:hypothetical protein
MNFRDLFIGSFFTFDIDGENVLFQRISANEAWSSKLSRTITLADEENPSVTEVKFEHPVATAHL